MAKMALFAVSAPGLETLAAQELAGLGLAGQAEPGGVSFLGNLEALYRANLYLRTASRVLVRLGDFQAITFQELRKKAGRLPWAETLRPGQAIALRVTCHKSRLYHSGAVSERIALAIGDALGQLPRLEKLEEDAPGPAPQLVVVRLQHDVCTVSVDSSGEHLHRRGYRLASAKAPLRETLAAGMLLAAGWDRASPLLDPFCGSGTIPIEAALLALGAAPGRSRAFTFQSWPGYESSTWEALLQAHDAALAARRAGTSLPVLYAADRDAGAVQLAQANAARAGVLDCIRFACQAVSYSAPEGQGWVVTNPPYGLRLASARDLRNLYAQFGRVLKMRCPGWQVAILCPDPILLGHTGLKLDTRHALVNGGVAGCQARRSQVCWSDMTQPEPPAAFHVMLKPRGALCNLDCQYCYYLSKEDLYPGSAFTMPDETLEAFTRQYLAAQRVPEVTFAWQGGEPTLVGLDFYRRAVAYQQKYQPPGVRVLNTLQTNGTTLDDSWCEFFKEHNFLVGLSLDGPQALHDAYRVDKGGRPTFERVMHGLSLLKKHGVEFNILSTVHRVNAGQPLAVYHFLRDEVGAQFIQFIPIVERDNQTGYQEGYQVKKTSVTSAQYGAFLIAIFDEWVRHDVGRVFVQIFDVALAAWTGQRTGLCIFEPTCGEALAMEHNGDLYACDHYVEPGYRLGNLHQTPLVELVSAPRQLAFGLDKRESLPQYCRACPVRFVCNGGCPKDRIRRTPNGEAGLNYLCAGYKAFFMHIDQPMKIMANLLRAGRAPAEVMTRYAR